MRIALDPTSIAVTTKSLVAGAAELSSLSARLRNGALPVMPYGTAAIVDAGIQQAAAGIHSIAVVLVEEATELARRVAMLRCGVAGGWDLTLLGRLFGIPGPSAGEAPRLPREFVEEQSIAWLAWLSEKGAGRLLGRLEEVNGLLEAAAADYDHALELFESGRYWDILMSKSEGAVPLEDFSHLFSQSKKLGILRTGARGLGVLGNVAGASLAFEHSAARSEMGRAFSAGGSLIFTRTAPLIAYDTVTGGAGTATADLLAVSLESVSDMEIELDELKAWSDANASGANGWMLQRYSQLGDAIGESDWLSMYETDDDGDLRLGPPWRWFD